MRARIKLMQTLVGCVSQIEAGQRLPKQSKSAMAGRYRQSPKTSAIAARSTEDMPYFAVILIQNFERRQITFAAKITCREKI